jgi:hypothetical protein
MRMSVRRCTRLTNGFSKKIENHIAAVHLNFLYYNFCRGHQTLRVTPAMPAGLSQRVGGVTDSVNLLETREKSRLAGGRPEKPQEDPMDDQVRDVLLADLADAKMREGRAREQLRAHKANIDGIRAALGNPYFYTGRSADDPESEARFTGYRSHEPGLKLFCEWKDAMQRIATVRKQLQDAGIESA